MLAKLKGLLKESRKAIVAGLGAGAGMAYTRLSGGITDSEWLEIVLAAVSVGMTTYAIRNGDKPMEQQR